jgi:nucleotide-binding universal stress UspA family protein
MSFITKIMAAVDLSKYSTPTARYASQLAKALDAELLFVNVINQRDVDTVERIMASYQTFKMDHFVKERLRSRHDEVNELIDSVDARSPKVRTIVRIGVPYQQLLAVIDEEKPDILVMATKGRSDIIDVVMGSCARIMHRRSPIPVLSIRNG